MVIIFELLRIVKSLRRKIIDENIQQIRFLQEEAQEAGEKKHVKEYAAQMNEFTLLRNTLDQAN